MICMTYLLLQQVPLSELVSYLTTAGALQRSQEVENTSVGPWLP